MSSPAERVAATVDDRPGCWGIAFVEWGRIFACFACLWATLALLFWSFLEIGIAVRGSDYLVMEQRFFGAFDRPLIPVVETNPVTSKSALVNTFNRPAGCTGDFAAGFVCDPATNPSWKLGVWAATPAWSSVYTACATAIANSNSTAIAPASSTADGIYDGYCLNVLPLNAFVPTIPAQPYPVYGLSA